ncbi:MAG: helix-turn-helix transcriptional regulator [Myxococcales bacterium]|nr:MAG: helix-turn-helix transcriptional regulator [Myxococcales bacterium]
MDINESVIVFDALSQETRMKAFRMLVEAGEEGLPAGQLSEALGTPQNTMSFHLSHMANAGVIRSRRQGRSIIYSANFALMRDLISFLVKDCCSVNFASVREDRKKGCEVIELAACCNGKKEKR